eukprot:TRINITY_DN1824_c0_g1_i6.p2 TRINITY_DN1824_c0_g1~~TRINITY_DN1824_c0_g1_i6.p2  ORF type:complete len:127 (-),score=33.63 TRINITY_DN1824_c0_g1_i6:262-642(-)
MFGLSASLMIFVVTVFFFFFSSRRRHTRCREVSWARRCVQETGINAEYMGSPSESHSSSKQEQASFWQVYFNADFYQKYCRINKAGKQLKQFFIERSKVNRIKMCWKITAQNLYKSVILILFLFIF